MTTRIDRRFVSRFVTWPDLVRIALGVQKQIPPSPTSQVYSPTTQLSVTLTSSLAAVDATNAKITVSTVGANGIVIIEADVYYEVTTSDTILARMTAAGGGAISSAIDVVLANAAVGNYPIHHTWVVTGLTPGTSPSWALYHQFRTATGAGALKAGGSGSTLRPPIVIKAITY